MFLPSTDCFNLKLKIGQPEAVVLHIFAVSDGVFHISHCSLQPRKSSGVHGHRAQFHHEEEDGALEGGNGADRTPTAGQGPRRSCFCFTAYIRLLTTWPLNTQHEHMHWGTLKFYCVNDSSCCEVSTQWGSRCSPRTVLHYFSSRELLLLHFGNS